MLMSMTVGEKLLMCLVIIIIIIIFIPLPFPFLNTIRSILRSLLSAEEVGPFKGFNNGTITMTSIVLRALPLNLFQQYTTLA